MKYKNDITLTVQRGRMLVFEKTGVYPEFLIFYSRGHRRTWRLKLKSEPQQGVLKINGITVFKYFFNGSGCTIQSVINDVVDEEWRINGIMMRMVD
ncbi:MAG TPA: hypothetical protein VLB74_10245 [Flavobacterium sp.]|uniref:hypothetical protein n=1 Tax=Flavobacterium sp. TaxID=239 RepID=UPI002B7D5CB1|nr:hypothetical protein [Flavobacterium sp.]HSD15016.1 hypothetical protein [Flavobacterium sp.]